MTGSARVSLAGSRREPPAGLRSAGPVNPAERIEGTLVPPRDHAPPPPPPGAPDRLTRDQLRGSYGSSAADQDQVATVLAGLSPDLEVTSSDPGSRRMTV